MTSSPNPKTGERGKSYIPKNYSELSFILKVFGTSGYLYTKAWLCTRELSDRKKLATPKFSFSAKVVIVSLSTMSATVAKMSASHAMWALIKVASERASGECVLSVVGSIICEYDLPACVQARLWALFAAKP